MPDSRRQVLQHRQPHATTHAGLWLDKYLTAQSDDQSKKTLVQQVSQTIKEPPTYAAFYRRWLQSLDAIGAKKRFATAKERLAINLGAESVLETSIALHRTYGVPYIPGSTLKGMAAAFARKYLDGEAWQQDGWAYKELFGTPEQAGCVTFFDALRVPKKDYPGKAFWPDIVTVHHPEYYRGAENPPADWDSPIPIPFLTATGKFVVALAGPDAWVETTFEILAEALYWEGVGAKTNSGYGRMLLEGYQPARSAMAQSGTSASNAPRQLKPSNDWPWRKGKMSKNRRFVIDAQDPNKRYPVEQRQTLPKGFTPGGKSEVDYAVIELEDGTQSVWVKKRFYRIPE